MRVGNRGTGYWALSAVLAISSLTPAFAASAAAGRLYAERAAMLVADDRCHLFDSELSSALAMGAYQARNTALRGGISRLELKDLTDLARSRGGTISCRDPLLLTEASRVRGAFSSFARLYKLNFPGTAAGWSADRQMLTTRVDEGRWALTTAPVRTAVPGARFGVVARDGQLFLLAAGAAKATGPTPASVRLVLRDPSKAADPYLPGKLNPAPRAFSKVIFASERRNAPDGGTGFRFSDNAIDALAVLDPREVVQLDFTFATRNGDRISSAVYEVGDFAAAVSFLRMKR